MAKVTTRRSARKASKSPFGRFANTINVKPTCSEITLTIGQYHPQASNETIDWGVTEIARVTLPYAAVKVAAFNLLACVAAAECGAGFISVPPGIQPSVPPREHVGGVAAARLAVLFNDLFAPAPMTPEALAELNNATATERPRGETDKVH